MRKRLLAAPCAWLLVCCAAPVVADTVTLSDGSRLVGRVERLSDGKIRITTEFAGELVVPAEMVRGIDTTESVNVEMESGDRLVGTLDWNGNSSSVQTAMGRVSFKPESVTAIWNKDGKSPEALILEKQVEAAKAEAEAARAHWELTLEAGVLYQDGNTEALNARGRVEVRRKSDKELLLFYLAGDYAKQFRRRSAAEARAGSRYEYSFTDRLFAYAKTDWEYDEFERLTLRALFTVGGGYYWLKEEPYELRSRLGVGFQHQEFFSKRTTDEFIAEVGLDGRWDITEKLRFTTANTWYPTFDALDNYRLESDNALIIPISTDEQWKIKLGALFQYNSRPTGMRERLDETYYANLVLDLK
ncbi:MAG: DUF481 domain-containing protein [Phycisphaerales bacterium]|nr:DUF481 domain-containing protein [Phycisphaerales bacterium]